ncbi:MAG: ribosome recycling factor [Planctomycetota bacterium]|jgi:ribosome recycling factor
MPVDDILLEAEMGMEKAVEFLVNEFKGVRTGRATPGLVENIKVDYYGSPTALKQLASITIPEPRMILLKPFDPGSLGDIEKAIQKSEVGLNPQNDGKIIRLVVPPLSEERRTQMAKRVRELGEKSKVTVRSSRRDANAQAEKEEKDGTIGEDDKFRAKEDIQDLTKKYEGKIDDLVGRKTKEVMEV